MRERKRRPVEIDRAELTIEEMNEGNVSEGKFNAMSLGPKAIDAFRKSIEEQRVNSPTRRAALTALDVIEKGCHLPLSEAIRLETVAFLELASSPEARQLIAEFFASRKK